MINERAQYPKSIDEPNLIVYSAFEESKLSVITEVPLVAGLVPNDFKYFIENWVECIKSVNTMLIEVVDLQPVQGVPVARSIADAPWPLSKRMMYTARYISVNYA